MPPLFRPDQPPAFEDDEKAECLASSLETQCSLSTAQDIRHAEIENEVERRTALPPRDSLAPVTADELVGLIKAQRPRKAPGADGITNQVIKLLPSHIIALLACIFNAAISNCMFPDVWKHAVVIGIPKPGKSKTLPSSYRPISLLNALGKLYEKVLLARLWSFIDSSGILIQEQFGFRKQHSCVNQVHRLTEYILTGLNRTHVRPTGAIFLDVAKAFDRVWHAGLIYKLYQFGVPDRLVLIIRDFLTARSFRYRVEGALSSPRPVRAGVPQGSALSPLLYSLYTNDIPKTPDVQLSLFADDTALYYSHFNPLCIRRSLQAATTSLEKWFRDWRIDVNPDKSAAILFTSRPGKRNLRGLKSVKMFGKPIPWVKRAKFLGVMMDGQLKFGHHIKTVRDRAAFVLGKLSYLLGPKSVMSLRHKITLYKTCIRPIMTYASVVFAHVSKARLVRLQNIQTKFLRRATGAPWYVRNIDLHSDLELPTVAQFMKEASRRFFERATHHPNSLVVSSADYSVCDNDVVRRPRHVLDDPDDPITAAIASTRNTSRRAVHNTSFSTHHRRRRRRRGPRLQTFTRYRRVPGRFSPAPPSPRRPEPRLVPHSGGPQR